MTDSLIEKKKQQRQFGLILIIVFIGFLGISIPYLIFPALFLNPNYSIVPVDWSASSRALLLGITLAAYPFGQFIGSPVLGSLSDDYSRKPVLWISLVISAICYLITGFAIRWENLSLLLLSRFTAGIMEGNIAVARAMAADLTTLIKHKTFGKINAAISTAFLLGPLLGGVMTNKDIYDGLTTSTPFYFICILFIFLAILTAIILENSRISSKKSSRSFRERLNLFKRLSILFLNKRLKILLLISTCFTLAVDIFYEFAPVYLTIKWTLDPAQLVIFNVVLCVGLAIGNGWLPSISSSYISNRAAIFYSLGAFSLFLMGIILTNSSIYMMFLFGLCGLVIGLAVTLLTVKISNSVEDAIQGEVMGVQMSLRVLGDAIICLCGGLLLMLSSKLILLVAVLISICITIYFKIVKY